MSCPPEYRYAIYVDGELEGDDLRELEAHLVGCQDCRARVVALQEESAVLVDVLKERDPVARPRTLGPARARGLAVGLAPAIGALALVLTLGGWLVNLDLPAGVGWLSPLRLIGAYEMLFDTIFVLRDRAPQMFDVVVAIGGLASAAALSTFLASALLRRLGSETMSLLSLVVLLGVALGPPPAGAFDLRDEDERITVGPDEVVENTLVISAESVTIEGTIEGDLFALAERLVVTGRVTGNVYAAGREVELRGEVGGAAHVAGERVVVEGVVAQNLYGAAETLTVREAGDIGGDATLFGETVRMNGAAGRDVFVFGENVELAGRAGRDVQSRSERISVRDGARIGRNLSIQTPDEDEIEIAAGAVVGGETTTSEADWERERGSRWLEGEFYLRGFVFLVSAFLVGMALQGAFPRLFEADLETSPEFFRTMGIGFVALIVTPIFLVLCIATVVGIPIGVIGLFVYLTMLFVSVIVVSALVGAAVTGTAGETPYEFGIALLAGLVIVLVAANLPFIGGLVRALVLLTGLGLLLTGGYEAWREERRDYA